MSVPVLPLVDVVAAVAAAAFLTAHCHNLHAGVCNFIMIAIAWLSAII